VVPKWVKGCDEPIKIAYDCGMAREFAQEARGRVGLENLTKLVQIARRVISEVS
jgi:hypothetical protein